MRAEEALSKVRAGEGGAVGISASEREMMSSGGKLGFFREALGCFGWRTP